MLRRIHKLAACTVAACLLCATAASTSAVSAVLSGEGLQCTATVTNGDTAIEVPVMQQTEESDGIVTTTIRVMVPDVTAEPSAQDTGFAASFRGNRHFTSPPGNGGESTFADPGFITYTTTLVYNVQTGQDDFRAYDLISFRLDREIFTMAPYNSIHNATARVDQAGFPDASQDPGLLENQTADLGEIEFGRTYGKGNDWPEDWLAAGSTSGSPQIGVTYEVLLDYADGTSRTLSFTHTAR